MSRMRAASIAASALLATTLAGCPSGETVQGIEHPGTDRASSYRRHAPSCRGARTDAWTRDRFCVRRVARDLARPRHLIVAPNGDLLVATRSGVVVLWDDDGDGTSGKDERATIGAPDVSAQGIALSPDGRFLYVADSRAVRRFAYRNGLRRSEGPGEVVVPDVPLTVDHPYRTITFDPQGRLYLAVGAYDNLTPGEGASIRRFVIPAALPAGGLAYGSGEVFAAGIRNPEALAWAPDGRLWAFVNGRDFLHPPGTDDRFYLDHPGDEIYRLSDTPGTFYGFPHCWLLGPVPWGARRDPTLHLSDPDANAGHDDAWCQDPHNVAPAAGALPAHTAPLGAVAYTGSLFPPRYQHAFFVTSHGSWNRHGEQRGRTLLAVLVDGDHVKEVDVVVGERAADGNLAEGDWKLRPVGVAQGSDGVLYVTSDETGEVLRVGYDRD